MIGRSRYRTAANLSCIPVCIVKKCNRYMMLTPLTGVDDPSHGVWGGKVVMLQTRMNALGDF